MAHSNYDKSGRFQWVSEFHVQTVFGDTLYTHCHIIEVERVTRNKKVVTEHCIGAFCAHVIELEKFHQASFLHHLN